MKNQVAESMIAIAGALLIAVAVGWAGSQGGATMSGLPLFALAGAFDNQRHPHLGLGHGAWQCPCDVAAEHLGLW